MERDLRDLEIDKDRLELAGEVTIYTFLSVVFLSGVICVVSKNRGRCSYSIWQNISFIQIIHWVNLINIDTGSEFQLFFKKLSIIFRPFNMKNICSDEPISESSYNALEIYSNGFINNAKEILVIYSAVILFCLISYLGKRFTKSAIFDRLMMKVKYSVIIRLHLVFFLDFTTFSMINLYFFTGKNPCSNFNMGFSIFFIIVAAFWIVWTPLLIKKKILTADLDLHHDVVFQSMMTLVEEFQTNFKIITYQYYTIYLLYRISLAFSFVVLSSSPSVQLFVIICFQILISNSYVVFYICKARPFKYKRDMISNIISEFLILVLFVFIGIRSMSLGPNSKYYMTVFCVIIIWLIEITISIRFFLSLRNPSYVIDYQANNIASIENDVKEEKNIPEPKLDDTKYIDTKNGESKIIKQDFNENERKDSKRLDLNKYTVKPKLSTNSTQVQGIFTQSSIPSSDFTRIPSTKYRGK